MKRSLNKSPRRPKARGTRALARNGQVTAIDLDSKMLSVVQSVRRGNRAAITSIVTEPLPTGDARLNMNDPEAIGRWIRATLKRLKVKPVNVVMSVPRAKVILKPLVLPKVDDHRELASMVHYQVTKDLPFDAEDAVVDFTLERHFDPTSSSGVPQEDQPQEAASEVETDSADERVDILATVVEAAVVENYRRLADAAGFSLRALGLRSYANARCVRLCESIEPEQAVAFVLLRPDEIVIEVLVGDGLRFSRSASVPGIEQSSVPGVEERADDSHHDDEDEAPSEGEILESIVKEVERTLRIYAGAEIHRRVKKVLVGGDTGHEFLVATALVDRLSLAGKLLDLSQALAMQAQDSDSAGAAIGAIGLALSANEPQGLPVDFLNPKRPPPRINTARRNKVALVAIALIVIVVAWGAQRSRLQERRQANVDVQSQIDERLAQQKAYVQRLRDEKAVREWIASDRKWLDHWSYLSRILPPREEVYVTNITSLPNGQIRISLHARTGEILAGLHEQLREAGYDVSPSGVTGAEDRHGYGFRSTVELVVPAGMQPDLNEPKPESTQAEESQESTQDTTEVTSTTAGGTP